MRVPGVQGRVQTVLGPIAPVALGVTLPHEHLLIDERIMYQEPSGATADARTLEALVPSNL